MGVSKQPSDDRNSSQSSDKPAKRLGSAIAKIRVQKNLSRAKLVERIHKAVSSDHPSHSSITESSLREIEEGNRVNVPRTMLEALCLGLGCTPVERLDIFLAADRNVFANNSGETTEAIETIIRGIETIYRFDTIVNTQINMLLNSRSANNLNEEELLEIIEKVILSALARKRKEKQQANPQTVTLPNDRRI